MDQDHSPPTEGQRAATSWQPIATAPRKDREWLLLWVVHSNAKFAKDAIKEGWAGACVAQWLDFNGGGWSWHGHMGQATHWMPLPPPPSR